MNIWIIRTILLVLLLFVVNYVSAGEPINGLDVTGTAQGAKVRVEEVCLNGYAFAVASVGGKFARLEGVSITQVYVSVSGHNHKPQPKKCTK